MFLANENFPKPSITFLRDNGFLIKSIQEDHQGISDVEVMRIAKDFDLIILTFDSDYGELIFKYAKNEPPAVIHFRDKGTDPLFAGKLLLKILDTPQVNVNASFTVVEENNIRQRFYTK